MNIQLRLTKELKEMDIEALKLNGKASNYLRRKGYVTIEDVATNWRELGMEKGIGDGTTNAIKNAVVNLMIQCLPEDELIEWFKYLINNNSSEDLRKIIDGFNKKEAAA